jgi:hypothetical protein
LKKGKRLASDQIQAGRFPLRACWEFHHWATSGMKTPTRSNRTYLLLIPFYCKRNSFPDRLIKNPFAVTDSLNKGANGSIEQIFCYKKVYLSIIFR